MLKYLLRLSFRNKLTLIFAILSIIPMLLVGIIACSSYSRLSLQITEKSSVETINLLCDDIDDIFSEAWNLCNSLTRDAKMQKYLRKDFPTIQEQYSNDLAGSMELASISTYRKNIFGVYVLGDNGGKYKSNYYSFRSEDQRENIWYQTIEHANHELWFPFHTDSFIVRNSSSEKFITLGMPMTDVSTRETNGIVAVDIEEYSISQRISQSLSNGSLYIMDVNGEILFTSNHNDTAPNEVSSDLAMRILNATQESTEKSIIIPDKHFLIVSRTLINPSWRIVGIIDRSFLTQSEQNITHVITILFCIITLTSLYSATLISRSIYRPIQNLCQGMEAVEQGDFSIRYTTNSDDEFGVLGKRFNLMLEQIQLLIKQIYEDQRKLKNSELRALQSQIQPHFLYNSLDSIIWLLRMGKSQDAEKMLTELSALFKISLSKGKEIISIYEELQHLKSYLFIINMIYGKKFDYQIECDPSLYSYRTLKLLLQPLVENAIIHSVPLAGQKVFIQVIIYEQNDKIIMSVQDLSLGISPEKLMQIQQILSSVSLPSQNEGYGLYNVNQRIRIYFGNEFGISIQSESGIGTEVKIIIPKLKGDTNFVAGSLM
ncbi:MAG: cache domain-containing sensor histidine kinase [Stomatobaculum sp.]